MLNPAIRLAVIVYRKRPDITGQGKEKAKNRDFLSGLQLKRLLIKRQLLFFGKI